MDEAIPARIRLHERLELPDGQPEQEFLRELKGIAVRNQLFKSYIGLGYYGCFTPSVILRNVLENPGWYTPYTPYQAEIAQGRLEGLLNFQTMVSDLTAMPIATASLLDEATAAAEAMMMLYRVQGKRIDAIVGPPQFLVADGCFPADDRGAPLARRASRHRAGDRRLQDGRAVGSNVRRDRPDTRRSGETPRARWVHRSCKTGGGRGGGRDRPAQPHPRDAARRAGG